jgi:hypothetical protein
MRVKRRKRLHHANRAAPRTELWRFTISPEIDSWRNVRQLDRRRVEIFIGSSCRDGLAA